jgi:galactose-1-phosphate uridylyltransferase
VAAEAEGERLVARPPGWVAFVPFAARWPFEVHLFPTRHLPDLPALDDAERDGLATLLKDVLGRFDALFDQPLPYMLTCHQAPVRRDRDLAHLHLEAFSIRRSANKLKYLASSESGAGVFINDIAPEQAAELLRAATPAFPLNLDLRACSGGTPRRRPSFQRDQTQSRLKSTETVRDAHRRSWSHGPCRGLADHAPSSR